MRTIYYKEAPEKIDSIASLLIDYLGKCSPATYWEDNNEIQCNHSKNRSLDDLILLCNHYFPGTEIKDLLRGVIEANELLDSRNMCIPLYTCGNIDRPVLHNSLYNGRTYHIIPVGSHAFSTCTKNSQFNMELICSIANEIYAEG